MRINLIALPSIAPVIMATWKSFNSSLLADIDINQKNTFGWFPFLIACLHGPLPIVRIMLSDSRPTTMNEKDPEGNTPISWAAYQGRLEVIKLIIASGREIDLGEEGSNSDAIRTARVREKTEILSLLERFKNNQAKTRQEIRKELGLVDELAAELFVLVVFRCDGYLEIRKVICKEREKKAEKFFGIVSSSNGTAESNLSQSI
jgi:hypothetical protein